MTAGAPLKMTAALRAGWRDLWRWPTATSLALATAMVGGLASRAGWLRARQILLVARDPAAPTAALVARAVAVVVTGAALAALLVDLGCAVALCAYAGAAPPIGQRGALVGPLRRGLVRLPAMLTIRGLELVIYATLALGEVALVARVQPLAYPSPAQRAWATTLLLAPAIVVAVYLFAAARVAQTLVARGLGAATALQHGLDVALRRLQTLARLAITASLWTAPLWLSAIVLPSPLGATLVALATVWSYAALVRVVGADGRLRGG